MCKSKILSLLNPLLALFCLVISPLVLSIISLAFLLRRQPRPNE